MTPAAAAPLDELFPRRAFRSFSEVSSRGLPQHSIQALAQDDEGVLWIATFDGVATFDGHEMRSVPAVPEAPRFGPYYALVPRRGGGMLAGGASGIHAFDGSRWRRFDAPGTVAALAETRGELWTLEPSGRVWRQGGEGWRPVETGAGAASALARGPDDAIWLATRGGVMRIGASERPAAMGGPLPSSPTALLVTPQGTAWAGTEAGEIFWLPAGEARWRRAAPCDWRGGRVRHLARDRRGRIWAGGSGGRVAFGGENGSWTCWGPENGLRSSAVTAILGDRGGDLWFGFVTDGLQQWVGEEWSHRVGPGGARTVITDIRDAPGGGFLAAAYDQGVWHWDGSALRVLGREAGLAEDTRAVVAPAPGTLWVGTRFGIFESREGGRFRQVLRLRSGLVTGVSVTGFFRAPEGTWYAVSSSEGIFRHTGGRWTLAADLNRDLPDPNVRAMTWRHDGELWVGTLRGVTAFSGGRGRTLAPEPSTGVPAHAQALLEAGPDEMWVGAFGGIGVWSGGRWRVLTEEDGLPGRTVYSMRRAPDGAIWVGGSHGVARFAGGRWTRYSTDNGLLSNECNVGAMWMSPDGSVLVGTLGSLARFDTRVAPLSLPELRIVWRELPGTERDGILHLAPGERSLRLSWSAPWLKPSQVMFRTRVPRLGPEWSRPQPTAELRIASLGPGTWDVEVSASIEGSAAWTEPRHLRFHVSPSFWETGWAWALYGIGIAALAILFMRLRTRRLARRAKELQAGIEAGLAQIKILRGLLPICSVCKKIRDDQGYWNRLEAYVSEHSEAQFSHGFCPECFERLYGEHAREYRK